MQRELLGPQGVVEPRLLTESELRMCEFLMEKHEKKYRPKNRARMIWRACFDMRVVKFDQRAMAGEMGLKAPQLACILNGTKHMPEEMRDRFCFLVGHKGHLQLEARRNDLELVPDELAIARKRLAEIEAKRAESQERRIA